MSNDDCRSGESRGIPASVNWTEHETADLGELKVPDKPSFPAHVCLLESDRSSALRDEQGSSGVRDEQDLFLATDQMVGWTYRDLPHSTNESIGLPDEIIELEVLESSDDAFTHHLVQVLEDDGPSKILQSFCLSLLFNKTQRIKNTQ